MADEDLPPWTLPYSQRVFQQRGLAPAARAVDAGVGDAEGAGNGGWAMWSTTGIRRAPPTPTSGLGHRYPRDGQGAFYQLPDSSSVTQLLSPEMVTSAVLCTTSGAFKYTAAHALAHELWADADFVIGVTASHMIASLLMKITSFRCNASTWDTEHNMVG